MAVAADSTAGLNIELRVVACLKVEHRVLEARVEPCVTCLEHPHNLNRHPSFDFALFKLINFKL